MSMLLDAGPGRKDCSGPVISVQKQSDGRDKDDDVDSEHVESEKSRVMVLLRHNKTTNSDLTCATRNFTDPT